MKLQVNDILIMKKPHPCGSNRFLLQRVGMDFKMKCMGCGHLVEIARIKAEKNIKSVERSEE